jgi:hypothetical protein
MWEPRHLTTQWAFTAWYKGSFSFTWPNDATSICMAEGTPRKLATATQPQFPRTVISLSWIYVTEWSSANWGYGNATLGKTEKLKFQATEHASLLAVALPRGFLVSAFLQFALLHSVTYCDVFPVNTSNNLWILDFMADVLVMRQAELQSIITIAVSLQSLLKSSQLITTLNLTGMHCTLC